MKHAENILPVIDQLLKKEKLPLSKIGALLIGRGPGSFTGLRVGYATVKGFLMVSKIPCYGALSLDLIAENFTFPRGAQLCVGLDARRDKVFSRLYRRTQTSWKPLHKPQTLPVAEWAASLPAETYLAGDAAQRYRSMLESQKNKSFVFLPEASGYPQASKMIELFLKDPKKFQKLETPKDFVPLYFRLSEAEERMNAGELKKHKRPRVNASHC